MDTSRGSSSRSVAISVLSWSAIGLAPILAYVAFWRLVDPSFYLFVILGTYLSLGGFAVLQILRATQMDAWTRRAGALAVVVGFAATISLGLRPSPNCLEPSMGSCSPGLTPDAFQ